MANRNVYDMDKQKVALVLSIFPEAYIAPTIAPMELPAMEVISKL